MYGSVFAQPCETSALWLAVWFPFSKSLFLKSVQLPHVAANSLPFWRVSVRKRSFRCLLTAVLPFSWLTRESARLFFRRRHLTLYMCASQISYVPLLSEEHKKGLKHWILVSFACLFLVYLFILIFPRQDFSTWLWLSRSLGCRSCWLWSRDPPASASYIILLWVNSRCWD